MAIITGFINRAWRRRQERWAQKKSLGVAFVPKSNFQIEPIESRLLLSADIVPQAEVVASSQDGAPAVVLEQEPSADQTVSINSSANSTSSDSPASPSLIAANLGILTDVAFNGANGEMLVGGDKEIDRIDIATGARLGSFDIPGSAATDMLGLQILSADIPSLGGTAVAAGSLLVVNGKAATDKIFALDALTGAQIAVLDLGQDLDPVAGVFHAERGSLFILSRWQNDIVELDPTTGAVLSRFAAPFAIGDGGLAIHPTSGNLWVGSSESNNLAEMTPAGTLLQSVDVASVGISHNLSGLAFMDGHHLLVSSAGGEVFSILDPVVTIPDLILGIIGSTVTVAINIDDATELGGVNIGGAAFGGLAGISYDTSILDATDASVVLGSVTAGGALEVNVNDETGSISFAIALPTGPAITAGSLVLINFQVKATATAGTTAVNLQRVLLERTNGASIILSPAPQVGEDVTDGSVAINTSLVVNQITPTASGFIAQFNRPLDVNELNLYSTQAGTAGLPDLTLTLVGTPNVPVQGSLILADDRLSVTFIRTGGILAAGQYTIAMRSAADGFKDAAGGLLDGNRNGEAGDDALLSFTIASGAPVVLSAPDFARGPGQNVTLPFAGGTGIPISLSDGINVGGVQFRLLYDPSQLEITGALLGSGLPADASLISNITQPGVAIIVVAFPTPLTAGPKNLVTLIARVPGTALYGDKQVLDLTDVVVRRNDNTTALSAADDGVHVVAYLGDTDGTRNYGVLDAQRILRNLVELDKGFNAYPLADPEIVGDVTDSLIADDNLVTDDNLDVLDAQRILRFLVELPVTEIPPLPAGLVVTPLPGPDPIVKLGSATGVAGGLVTIPLTIDDAKGLAGVKIELRYDTTLLDVVLQSDVRSSSFLSLELVDGELLPRSGFASVANAIDAEGRVLYSATWNEPLAAGVGGGTLMSVRFTVKSGVTLPPTIPIDLFIADLSTANAGQFLEINPVLMPGQFDAATDGVITIPVADADADGVPDNVETGDGNRDGIADANQGNVGTLRDFANQNSVTFVAPTGVSLKNLRAIATPAGAPAGATFPVGLFDFDLTGVAAGGTTTVDILLPSTVNPNTYYKFGSELGNTTAHFYSFLFDGITGATFFDNEDIDPSAAVLLADRVRLTFRDGARGDSDLTANGTIDDPGGPAVVQAVNVAPVITSNGGGDTANINVAENTTLVTTVTANDADGPAKIFSLFGGVDAGLFTIDEVTGALAFLSAPDFEFPLDADGDNIYDVTVAVSDTLLQDTQDLFVTVTNVVETPAISGVKFNDLDGDGIRDAGEPGLAGWSIQLDRDNNGTSDALTVTGADGSYSFENVAPGSYKLSEVQQAGYVQSAPTGGFYLLTLVAGDTFTGRDFGNVLAAEIIGRKFLDLNGNGLPDGGAELPLAGVTIRLDRGDDGSIDATTVTGDAASLLGLGFFNFSNLLPGVYRVSEVVPTGYTQTGPAGGSHLVTLTAGEIEGGLFFFNQVINQAPVITSNGGGASASVNVPENTTAVTTVTAQDPDAGQTATSLFSLTGGADQLKFTINGSTGALSFATAPDFENPTDVGLNNVYDVIVRVTDAGNLFDEQAIAVTVTDVLDTGSISGVKYEDVDGDAVRDTGEPGLAGWTIFLDSDLDGVLDAGETSTVTASGGSYQFLNLAPGSYRVAEVIQAGWMATTPVGGNQQVAVLVGQISPANFGNFLLGSISGIKFNDLDGDGVQDLGEAAMVGVTIFIDVNNNGTDDGVNEPDTLTNATGNYSFTNLGPGSYIVREIVPAGFMQTGPEFTVVLTPEAEVPVNLNPSIGFGYGSFVLDEATNSVAFEINFGRLAGTVNGLHIHTGAAGVAGGIIYDLGAIGGFGNPSKGVITLVNGAGGLTIAQQIERFNAGTLYVNLHTSVEGDGEIRGQILSGNANIVPMRSGLNANARNFANQPLPSIAINDVQVVEGNIGTSGATFTVSLSHASAGQVTVQATTANGTASAPGDYAAAGPTTLTFLAGETTKQFTVNVNGDTTFELNETFFVNLTNAINASISDNQGLGTIQNDDAAPVLTINDVTLAEGNAGTTAFTFTVTKTGATELTATVDAQSTNGTATEPGDYSAVPLTTLTFLAGETSKQVTVNVNGDTTFELNESFFVNLTNAINATISDNQGLGTITNDDAAPTIAIDDVTLVEGNAGTTAFTFTVTKSGATELTATVDAQSANGTATAPGDYSAVPLTTLTFLPGEISKQITVNVNGDLVFENNETFLVNLTNAINASISDNQGLGTITNDDAAPTLAISDVTLAEGNAGTTAFTFTVTKTGATELTATVDAESANGTATAPGDYSAVPLTTLTFLAGETSKQVTVNVNGDTTFELNESFFVNLTNAINATISDNQGQGTIQNDDAAPSLAVSDVTLAEGNAGTTAFTFTVTKTGLTELSASVDAATANGTASAPGDYAAAGPTTLTFLAGETTKQFTVNVNGDTTFELNETFFVNLTNATNASISDNQGLGTITNDDAAPVLAIGDVTLAEGNAGTTAFTFTVTKTGATELTATVDAQSTNGTATEPGDYSAVPLTTLTFLAGETSKQVTVDVNGDMAFENDETFFVNLTNAINATISDNQGLGTITTTMPHHVLTIGDVTLAEGNAGTTAFTFTVTKTGLTELSASVDAATANGTASAPGDYTAEGPTTLTFLAGETTKQFTVNVNGDTTFELNETFFVNLTNAINASISDNQGLGTITNDDAAPVLTINDVTLAEGNAGTTAFTFTVTKTGATELTATVDAQSANGTATAPGDYVAVPLTTLTFLAGETSKQVTVNVNGDTTFELNETFFVNLTNAINATISDNQGLGTIQNDDAAPVLTIGDVTLAEGNAGTTAFTFTVTKTGLTELSASVDAATANGTASAPGDYTAAGPTTLTFAPGTTSQTFTVQVNGDLEFENNETFLVNLTNALNATIGDNQATGTITNDDAAPVFTIGDVTLAEGNAGTTAFTFTVTKSGLTELSSSVDAATANGTASAPGDYTAAGPTTLTFAPGVTSQTFTVQVNGDTTFELNETFFVNLTNAINATISDNQGQGTIQNDDAAPVLTIGDVTLAEGDAGLTAFSFTVTKTGATELTATVDAQSANGTATAPGDYSAVPLTTLTFLPGETTKQVTVNVNGDMAFENDETFFVNLTNAINATISDNQGQGTIQNDDAAPTLAIGDVSLAEGNSGTTAFTFTVTKTGLTELSASVDAATANGTASAPGDYAAAGPTTLTFLAGETAKQFTVNVNGDTLDEPNETFFVNLSSAINASIGDSQGLGTIINDDGASNLSIGNVSVTEGNAGTKLVTFTVNLVPTSGQTVTVNYATVDGTASSIGLNADYVAASGTLMFAPGISSQTVDVTVNGDTRFENDETFTLNLSSPVNATIVTPNATGTITNDDAAPVLTIGDVSLAEGNAGTTTFTFTISKNGLTELGASVDVASADGTATAPGDYGAVPLTTLTFLAGETSKQVTVNVNGDTAFELNESFFVNLTNAINATISDSQGVGTITNDDAAPTLAISDVTLAEGNAGTTAFTFTVTKTGATELTATVDAQSANGTATAPGDYGAVPLTTLTFLAGETSKQVTVNVNGDTTFELNETFFVNLTNAINATISDNQGLGTITNDDAAPVLTIGDVTLAEGNAGTTAFTFTVTKTGATELTATVDAQSANGTATAPGDYSAVPLTTLTFLAGETSKQVTVDVNGDMAFENDETFLVNLTNAINATISDNQGQGTITNDDAAPTLAISDVTLAEGNAGTTAFTFTVTKTGATELTATVDAESANGTATAPGDYSAVPLTTLTFLAGETSKQVTVNVNGDTTFELNESFFVNLTNAINATISDNQGQGTIQNDDAAPVLAIGDVTLAEGNAGTTAFTFTVTKTGLTELSASVDAATANGTASAPGDYTAAGPTTLTFAPGTTSQTFTVQVNGDLVFENNETFLVNLTNALNATIGDNQATGTITNDDAAPVFTIGDVTLAEGNAGTTAFTFTVTKSGLTELSSSVDATSANGTASAPGDYTAAGPTTLTFAPGVTSQTFTVQVNGDLVFENNETFLVNLTNALNATIGDNQATGTITNDDAAPVFTIGDVTLAEGNAGTTAFTFTVTKTGLTELSASVDAATANGTASAPGDYTAAGPTTLSFAPGVTSQTFTVQVNGDLVFENNETFLVNLTNALNATIGDNQATGTITNDDAAPVFTIGDVTLAEGNSGTTAFTFTVTKTGLTELSSSVDATSANGTASAPGDYTAAGPTTLSFAPGVTSQTFTVQVNGDLVFENNETFLVNLTNALNATIGDNQATGTITNDDAAPVLTIGDVTLAEGNAGTTAFTFTVTKTGLTELSASVDAATANGTASAPGDYTAEGPTTLTFLAGETTKQFTVNVNGDTTFELNETFFINLTNAINATISDNQGQGTIQNDDAAPVLTIGDVTLAEGNAGTTAFTFTVTKTGLTELSASVDAATANGTASAPGDYTAEGPTTLTFLAGETTKQFTVNVNGDTAFELNETFFVNLTNAINATISDNQGLGTITNDDAAPVLTINDVTLAEGNAGTTAFTFTVTKSGATELTATVDAQSANGTATVPGDYSAVPLTTLTFAPGETSKQVTVSVNGDNVFENNEMFLVNLTNAINATISDNQGLGTITNDDAAPVLTIGDVTLAEGNAGLTEFTFTISKTGLTELGASVDVASAAGTATAGSDYTAVPLTTLTFAAGEISKQVTVNVTGDAVYENDESFFVNLTNALNATISDNQGEGSITNDDAQPAFTITPTVSVGEEAGTVDFTVTLTGATDVASSVQYATANGTATAGADYTAVGLTTLNFGAQGTTPSSQTINVTILEDTLDENNETFTVNLSSTTQATIGAGAGTGTGTIIDNDAAPTVSVVVSPLTGLENDAGTATRTFTVSLSATSGLAISVEYALSGTAASASDYSGAAATGTLSFAAGETSKTVVVTVSGDAVYELEESIVLTLSNPTNATLGTAVATTTIQNDDAQPAFAISDVTLAEGNAGTTTFTFTVTKSGLTELSSSVDAATTDSTALAPGDYAAAGPTTLTFAASTTSQTFTVNVNGDAVDETDETFLVNLTNAINATIGDNQGVGAILNDDQADGNTAPVAHDDSATTQLHTAVVIDVLANDTDAQGDQTIAPSTVLVGTGPSNGTVSVDPTSGAITYTPGIGFFGTDSFIYTVADAGGLTSNVATVTVAVEHDTNVAYAALVADDPVDPDKTALVVLGTDGDDKIRFIRVDDEHGDHHDGHDDDHGNGCEDDGDERPRWAALRADWRRDHDDEGHENGIMVIVNGQSLGVFNPTGRIIAFGLKGSDDIKVDEDIGLAVELHGDDGDDKLEAGNGPAALLGGSGDDSLIGGKGKNILIGGGGKDRLGGGAGQDILIGGTTSFDRDPLALGKILTEWSRRDLSFSQRVDHLVEGDGMNDGLKLSSSTMFDDLTKDRLSGGSGKDWLFLESLDKADKDRGTHGDD